MEHGGVFRRMREKGDYSDVTIVCGSQIFRVHRNIICLRSDWFAAHCRAVWMNNSTRTITIKAIDEEDDGDEDEDFSCDDPEAVSLMLDFIYLGNYELQPDIEEDAESNASSPYTPPAQVLANGRCMSSNCGRFGCGCIVQGAHSIPYTQYQFLPNDGNPFGLFGNVSQHLNNGGILAPPRRNPTPNPQPKGSLTVHARLYGMASKYQVKDLKHVAWSKMDRDLRGVWAREDFAKAIEVAFGSTPEEDRNLRNMIIEAILGFSASLINDPTVMSAINAVEGLSLELFKRQSAYRR